MIGLISLVSEFVKFRGAGMNERGKSSEQLTNEELDAISGGSCHCICKAAGGEERDNGWHADKQGCVADCQNRGYWFKSCY